MGDCPIGMRARYEGGLTAQRVTDGKVEVVQRMHLNFWNLEKREVAGAAASFHGYTAQVRYAPLEPSGKGGSDISRTVDFQLALGKGEMATKPLALKSFGSVSWIDLRSVTYADGSVWKAAEGSNCRIEPDRFLLVGGQ
ncbi:hypothetical protein [Granulicella sibirica]|uniref:hypothetical protein n=1 Tax=Granulicella sibirica TaxID=2479048 RepID=UPI0010091ABA|nr:hypothetical protein [Granulicella sibirica]